MWTAESEKTVTAALIDEYAAAATTAVGPQMNELDCPRLVFITPYTPPEKRTIKTRVTEKITKAVKDRHRLTFLDPVTGTAVPCGTDGQGYVLKLPSHFLRQHGSKIRDGLAVLKLVAGLGKCAGLPLDLGGMPTEVVSMEEAQAIKMFEALLDSAASEGYTSSKQRGVDLRAPSPGSAVPRCRRRPRALPPPR